MALVCRFRIRSIHSQWRITPRREERTQSFRAHQVSDCMPPGTPLTTGVRYSALEAGSRTNKITTHNYEFTGGLKGNLAEFGDYFKTWNWESGFRYNEDQRIQRFGGIVDNNALRAALLDTNPATAFNPFGINQNSPAVINKIFVTTQRYRHDLAHARRPQVIWQSLESSSGAYLLCGRW